MPLSLLVFAELITGKNDFGDNELPESINQQQTQQTGSGIQSNRTGPESIKLIKWNQINPCRILIDLVSIWFKFGLMPGSGINYWLFRFIQCN